MTRREFLSSLGLGLLLAGPSPLYGDQQNAKPKTIPDDTKAKLDQEGECYSSLHLLTGYDPEPSKIDTNTIKTCPRYTKQVRAVLKPGPDEELYVKFNNGEWRRIVTVG